MLSGQLGRKNSQSKASKPLQKLNKDELNARGIYEGNTKKELEKLLTEQLHGVQTVPALLYNNPTSTLESINCGKYKITNINKFIEQLGSINWSQLKYYDNPYNSYNTFLAKFTEIYNNF